jgi:hypothetical protein
MTIDSTPFAETKSNSLTGTMFEKSKEISNRLVDINSWSNDAAKFGSWRFVLGGSSPVHMVPESKSVSFNDYQFARKEDNLFFGITSMQLKLWLGRKWNTGCDLNNLADTIPDDRWKYYLSLNLKNEESREGANNFFETILQKCRKEKLSLMTKTQDHNYDSLLIYTFHPEEMDNVIQEAYKTSSGNVWEPVRRVFQKPISGVNPLHIARVQEPFGGHNGSHSSRMGIIGGYLDEAIPGQWTVNSDDLVRACKIAGVKPESPWEIATI